MKQVYILLTLLVFVWGAPSYAQAGLFEFFFPSLKKKPYNPYETMQAPFADQDDAASAESTAEDKTVALDVPHRTDGEISRWLEDIMPAALTFESPSYERDLRDKEQYFDGNGLVDFRDFLTDQKLITILQSGRYHIRTVTADIPILLNEGAVDGRFRWLFRVPVMVSYMEKSMTDYKEAKPVNQFFSITVQIGRRAESRADPPHHVLIESWAGQPRRVSRPAGPDFRT